MGSFIYLLNLTK